MKNKVLRHVLNMTKRFIHALIIQCVTMSMLLAANGHAQVKSIDEVIVRIGLRDIAVEKAFARIEKETGYNFVYTNKGIERFKKIHVDEKRQTLYDLLAEISLQSNLEFKQVNHNIHVQKGQKESGKVAVVVDDQEITVSGTVRDESGEPLPGATITIQGSTVGTVTDINGAFTITAPEGATLEFSYIGFETQSFTLGSETTINIILRQSEAALDEVVVIGYGTRERKDVTGAISTVDSEEIARSASMSPELAIQGRMAGVYVSNPGSDPNSRPTIRIRGVSTLGFNEPLYVIDGVPLTEGGASGNDGRTQDLRGSVNVFNMINPNDIASISVLKDASATAIYGVRASNGVILITTKRGAKGKPRVEVSSRYGVQNIYHDWEVMGIQDYVNTYREALANNPAASPDPNYYQFYDAGSAEYLGNNPYYTQDWLEAARTKNAAIQDYNVSVTGGNEVSNYAVGVGYSDQENALYYSNYKRYSAFVNSDHQITDWLKVGESFRFIYSQTQSADGPGLNTAFSAPWQPLYDPNGLNGYALPGRTVNGSFLSNSYGGATRDNTLGIGTLNTNQRDMIRNIGSFYAEASPLEGLRLRGTLSFDYYTNTRQLFEDQREGLFEANQGRIYTDRGNTFNRRLNENINIVKEFLIGYNKSFGGHNFDIILNAMDQKVQWNVTQNAIENNSIIPNWDQRRIAEGWAGDDKNLFFERYPSGLQGYMGRMSYNFDSRYYLDVTVRRDGTSKFGPGYKWGTFPSVAGAWRISSENFMQSIPWLNDLKIRAGWGMTGNQETRDFAFLSLVNFNPVYSLGSGAVVGDGVIRQAAALGDFPVVDMSWETVTTTNLGFDAVMLQNKLSLTMEYYQRYTDGILQAINIPQVIGALSQPVINLANVDNRGFEMQAVYQDRFGEVGYSASANLTTVRNRVSNLYRGRPTGNNYGRIEEGHSINFLYGYKTNGIFQTEEEVSSWLNNHSDAGYEAQKSPGDIRFVDIQGPPLEEDGENAFYHAAPDGKIDAYDQTYIGKTIPGYYYGLGISLDYKNFDLSIDFRGMGDVQKIFTNGKQSVDAGGGNYLVDYLDRWTPSNPSNTIPRAIHDDPSGNNRIADRHVENAGFFRFQNFQLGYNFQGELLNRIGVTNLRPYLMGQNLLVFSPYPGLDPENDSTPTSFIFGVNLGF